MENINDNEDIKPDLKHDTMEYSASTDGDDILDIDSETAEEILQEEISADELNSLEDDSVDDQAIALINVEEDRNADNDIIFNNNDDDEELDDNISEKMERK